MGRRKRRYELPYTHWVPKINDYFQIGYPKGNQDFVCLQKNGVSKVNQDLSVCFGEKESGGTCRLMMQGISLCDHVTERAVTERGVTVFHQGHRC